MEEKDYFNEKSVERYRAVIDYHVHHGIEIDWDNLNFNQNVFERFYENNVSFYSQHPTYCLKDLLVSGLEDFILFSSSIDTPAIDIVGCELDVFTQAGLLHFSDVLNAPINSIDPNGYFGFSIVLDNVSSNKMVEFANLLAGYVSHEKYNLYINNPVLDLER